ncbi:hypothetical protein B7P43_G15462, partial [Cryptotermes secundus]
VQFEQRLDIKFFAKPGKTATETLQLLRDADGDEALSRARVFEWHRRFVAGRVSVEGDTRSGRPSSSRNEDNVVREDRTVTVCMLADALNINKSTCNQILREDLGACGRVPVCMRVCAIANCKNVVMRCIKESINSDYQSKRRVQSDYIILRDSVVECKRKYQMPQPILVEGFSAGIVFLACEASSRKLRKESTLIVFENSVLRTK